MSIGTIRHRKLLLNYISERSFAFFFLFDLFIILRKIANIYLRLLWLLIHDIVRIATTFLMSSSILLWLLALNLYLMTRKSRLTIVSNSLKQTHHFLYDIWDGAILLDHFFVVWFALDRVFPYDHFTHLNINFGFLPLPNGEIEKVMLFL